MKLGSKLLLSHLAVALISISLAGLLAVVITAGSLNLVLLFSLDLERSSQLHFATQPDEAPPTEPAIEVIIGAIVIGGIIASAVAAAISLLISRRIVRPVRAVAKVSRYIAKGHYASRVEVNSTDELGELAVSFNQMAAALANTETTRRQLLADISHELKTPLASIKAYMEGFQDGVIAPTKEHFYQVHREADRLQRLVNDLQELSLVAEGAVKINPTVCLAAPIVESVVERLQPQFEVKGISLTTEISPNLPAVCVDRERIEQVLINLLGNGLQYTPVGGRVVAKIDRHNDSLRFVVQDTGIGIAPDNREWVFQRFFRVDKSRARSRGGSGIGLTIARYLVEAHHGRIWVESPGENQGSTFYFTVPIA
ncbi:MAG: ATP-binding protein [Anaerolineae bacterium]|nr:ATP-binding protein [Anaerolineae bacterium]NUQ07269.1 HAMP domain-containing protein [Anaerolineae bacterium]